MREAFGIYWGSAMGLKQALCLVGSTLLIIGVFSPIASILDATNISYFHHGKYGVVVLAMAVISPFFLICKPLHPFLWMTSINCLWIVAFSFYQLRYTFNNLAFYVNSELGHLAGNVIKNVPLQWGWLILFSGSLLLLISAFMRDERALVAP